MPALELMLNALNQRYEKYLAERKRCKNEFSDEAVHDLRVTARRLLALIELLRVIAPQPCLQKLRRAFKEQLDSLDELRDTQVLLVEISETIQTLPELAPLQKFLQKREKRLLNAAEHEVRALKLGAIARRVEQARNAVQAASDGQDLTALLLSVVDEACLVVNQRLDRVEPSRPASIHAVRVAFKKFRYMLEIIQPILPGFPDEQFKLMQHYQTVMGEIQDVEVLLRTLDDFAVRHSGYDPQPAQRYYQQRHSDLITAYIQNMREFDIFWRPAPDKPFPWKTQEEAQQ